MLVYTVYEPGKPAKSLEERAEDVIFVKEGFSWLGFFVAPLWLLINRLWIEFLLAVILTGGIAAGLVELGLGEQGPGIANLLLALIVGFEGNDLKRWRLERKGYVYLASVAGRNTEECERRFFDAWLPHAAAATGDPRGTPPGGSKPSPAVRGTWQGPTIIGTLPGAAG